MMNPSDESYRRTRLVKQGAAAMPPLFRALAEWIAAHYSSPVPLNIVFDSNEPLHGPRLDVIFERKRDADSFMTERTISYDPAKQAAIKARFLELLDESGDTIAGAERLFVIFSAFEPAARREANSQMTPERIEEVEKSLSSTVIWKIRPGFGTAIIFFHTEAQLKMTEDSDFRERCRDAYMAVLGRFDEFGYFRANPIGFAFDSKENFDAKYQGSWFAYDR
ncbi:hypothetical protein [Sphingopyxis sp. PET50]|uniref:hypothetical protein n=1 Tax=Sphingopyxis sp. PET50 TaxID=2976533 RepID=UPI0021B0707D|nr:hypothetical protein [Sphingopyxis sp. PET50]